MEIFDENLLNTLTKELNIEPITAKCLLKSGLKTVDECKKFLYPKRSFLTKVEDYIGFLDVKERIERTIENKEKVVIYGDYDCDGVCATAMLYLYLTSKGVDVSYFIPDRRENGYGMNQESLEKITEEYLPDLLITVDCGIACADEIDYINEALGFDVIVTDHHAIPEKLPDCLIFNPHMSNNGQFRPLCGAGVVLRLIEGLSSYEESLQYYDIAALATIADVVPLVEDNRYIVKIGLELLNKKKRLGLKLLIESFTKDPINSIDISFKLSPRINAVGRLADANKVVDLFIEDDTFILKSLVEEINSLHSKRQNMTKRLEDSVERMLENYDFDKNPIVVLYKEDWDEGIIGITAAQIVQEYHHPVILFTKSGENIKGSGRSLPGVNIFECISNSKEYLLKFGGHPQACGLTLSLDNLENFINSVNDYCKNNYSDEIFKESEEDCFDFREIKNLTKVVKEVELLQPFGEKNKMPLFFVDIENIKFSKIKDGLNHIIYKNKNFQMVGFNMGEQLNLLNSQVKKKFYFNMSLNYFNNIETIQAIIKNVKYLSYEDYLLDNYLTTSLYKDSSCFNPEKISIDDSLKLIDGNNYTTAYICFCKETFDDFISKNKNIKTEAFFVNSHAPNNKVYFNIGIKENLSKYKNIVFLDKPINLGYIDELLLNKDCKVYYVENNNGYKMLSKYLPQYNEFVEIYKNIAKNVANSSIHDAYNLYIDIEKSLNVNYNNFVITLCILMDLGIVVYTKDGIKIDKSIKNPLQNSKLYQNILGAEK